MTEHVLQSSMTDLIQRLGDMGVFIAMLLESSVIPIPSEVVVVTASVIGISTLSIVIFGALGSTLGAMIGYSLGRYGAMPVILKFGKYIFVKPHHIYKAEAFSKKHGAVGVLIGRVIPIVPFKVFSIASGMTKVPFVPFVIFTFVGVVPRMYLLAIFGSTLVKYTKPVVLICLAALLIFAAVKITRKLSQKNGTARE